LLFSCPQSHCSPHLRRTHALQFRADRTHNLIVRLRHSVIRAGLRRISLAYSRISLADVVSWINQAAWEPGCRLAAANGGREAARQGCNVQAPAG